MNAMLHVIVSENLVDKAFINDRVGNVKEYFYDAGNRLVIAREYTGRAVVGLPTNVDTAAIGTR